MTETRNLICTVVSLERLTHDVACVRLRPADGDAFTFRAGQYVKVTFAGQIPRAYSLASLPNDPFIEFHIRQSSDGSTSRFVNEELRVGEQAMIEGPMGENYLRDEHAGPIIGIAGGSGLAPVRSIVETALRRGVRQPVALYFGVRAERDLYMERHFDALAEAHGNFRFVPVLSEAAAGTARRTGLVHEAALADFTDFAGFTAYLAGPPVMIVAARDALIERGLRPDDFYADMYGDPPPARKAAAC